jgi:hypothetical protein
MRSLFDAEHRSSRAGVPAMVPGWHFLSLAALDEFGEPALAVLSR